MAIKVVSEWTTADFEAQYKAVIEELESNEVEIENTTFTTTAARASDGEVEVCYTAFIEYFSDEDSTL